jgi:hypothetical protein
MLSQQKDIKPQTGKTAKNSDETDVCRSTPVICPVYLEATSFGSTAARSLNQERIGQVHSVFTRVVNVLTSGNRLISVVGADVGNGPINIVTNLPRSMSMTSIGMGKNDEVLNVDGSIVLGNNVLIISTKNAKQWKPQRVFRGKLLATKKIRGNLKTMREVACAYGRFGGLAQLIEYAEEGRLDKLACQELNPFARRALPHLSMFMKTIKTKDYQGTKRSAQKLVGLGPGLTPSADDVLSGLMASLTLISQNLNICGDMVSEVNKSIISCIQGRTTLISQEFLMHAGAGDANEPILALIEKILTARPNEVEEATKHVLAIGEASGTDVVFGIFLGSWLLLDEVSRAGKRF